MLTSLRMPPGRLETEVVLRHTAFARRYLAAAGLLVKHQSGRNVYFINMPLMDLFRKGEGGAA